MKRILRYFVVDTLSLYIIANSSQGIIFNNGLLTLLMAGFVLSLATILVKPLINILLLPINLLTFNIFKWASSTIALYLVTLVVPGFIVSGFDFAGFSNQWIDIPAISLQGLLAFIVISFLLSVLSFIITWLIK